MRIIAELIGGLGLAVGLGIGFYKLLGVFANGLQKGNPQNKKGNDENV